MDDNNPPAKNPAAAPAVNGTNGKRKRAAARRNQRDAAAAIGYGAYWWIYQRHYESTDKRVRARAGGVDHAAGKRHRSSPCLPTTPTW